MGELGATFLFSFIIILSTNSANVRILEADLNSFRIRLYVEVEKSFFSFRGEWKLYTIIEIVEKAFSGSWKLTLSQSPKIFQSTNYSVFMYQLIRTIFSSSLVGNSKFHAPLCVFVMFKDRDLIDGFANL